MSNWSLFIPPWIVIVAGLVAAPFQTVPGVVLIVSGLVSHLVAHVATFMTAEGPNPMAVYETEIALLKKDVASLKSSAVFKTAFGK